MNFFNREPFLPLYDFDALEAEPEYTPPTPPPAPIPVISSNYWQKMLDEALYKSLTCAAPAPKTLRELISEASICVKDLK